jgi:predicted transposase
MITIKLPLQNYSKNLDPYLRQYNSTFRFSFNRFLDGKTYKEIYWLVKDMNNTELLDISCKESAIKDAQKLIKI